MNYELAKELKDAGFLQQSGSYISETSRSGAWDSVEGIEDFEKKIGGKEHWAYIPTLSELIEACGDKFHRLEKGDDEDSANGNYWLAYTSFDEAGLVAQGATPEIAVAKLWLALNRKV